MATCVLRWLTRRTTSTAASRGLRARGVRVRAAHTSLSGTRSAQVGLLAVDEVGNLEVERQVGLVQRRVAGAFCSRAEGSRQHRSTLARSTAVQLPREGAARRGGARTDVAEEQLARRGRGRDARRGPGAVGSRSVVRRHADRVEARRWTRRNRTPEERDDRRGARPPRPRLGWVCCACTASIM